MAVNSAQVLLPLPYLAASFQSLKGVVNRVASYNHSNHSSKPSLDALSSEKLDQVEFRWETLRLLLDEKPTSLCP
ncbi:hypothetical protein HOLleu_30864 [Holothuria leucospilota]|uniref:Uncharacterized protein n=1 Tax=Holothuria leucospilota TaxID=206669 RepID=A0A9Q1BKZ4_HOLLE|nr:hypothetical protein HOLleu_30864 [Holothuria leucospilota]